MSNRRSFIKKSILAGTAVSMQNIVAGNQLSRIFMQPLKTTPSGAPFIPNRVASWWAILEDIQWPQKKIVDKIKKRAAGFAEAKIDTAIGYGFHVRFDFSNYFSQLHGYYANVSEELKKYGIRFMDHYSCNNVERPANNEERLKLNENLRHHVLLYHDEKAAATAQYEGHYFKDLYQIDIRNGEPGYSPRYQFRPFCFNNPGFTDMHKKYLERLIKEVPMDGIEVDDMCDYAGLYVCGCVYCRDRFKKEYGHSLPPMSDKNFWGDIKNSITGGNYANPAFRDWMNLRANSIVDHLKMVKSVIGELPLMTCCSSTGPISLNGVSLNQERMAPELNLFMLENVGMGVSGVNWTRMDAEAMHQKEIAASRNNAPAMAISYTIYDAGGYLGWALSRFWGVANWSSTEAGVLIEDPEDVMETHEIIKKYNLWEDANSPLYYRDGKDLVEARIIINTACRDNGWKDAAGREHWTRATGWSDLFLKTNVGYRFVGDQEFADSKQLLADKTPVVIDGAGCVSDRQFEALQKILNAGTPVWLSLPFGTHDEKGF
ncbi:MAG: hypothetical protein J7539_14860, partial [Niabella sp.]|nr:hypothetical protein [Niabella sp.]